MSIAIRVENLSKEYHIANVKDRMGQDHLLSTMLFERKNGEKVLKALDNISFEISKGESVAIIGRNGSGKSTLFKILSKITIPTTGTVKYMGKVASLLEVGSGLHPDLSARENIYFYGKILGMKKNDIANRFDDIVAFCGFEDFLDVQIKKHSIGMQLRLALSVAVHLDASILLFDEVLSVGDMEFQNIMINKLRHITKENNKTLLFISHDFRLLHEICDKGIVLNKGKLVFKGKISDAIDFYKQMYE